MQKLLTIFIQALIPLTILFIFYSYKSLGWTGIVYFILFFTALLIFIFLEIFLKSKFYQLLSSRKYIIASSEEWRKLEPQEFQVLEKYTNDLIKSGFEYLDEVDIEPSENSIGRLLVNKQESCFARISKSNHFGIYCQLSTRLEQGWVLSISNCFPADNRKYLYFNPLFTTPRIIHKFIKDSSSEVIFNAILEWRQEVSTNLGGLKIINQNSVQEFFEMCSWQDKQQARKLLITSITWGLIHTQWCIYHPRFEWLGDYPKLKAKSKI